MTQEEGSMRARLTHAAPIALAALFAAPLPAQTCTVPGTHPSVQAAVDDGACTLVQLAGQTYAESPFVTRTVALEGDPGGGSVVEGALRAAGTGVVLTAGSLAVANGCLRGGLTADRGARIHGAGVSATVSATLPCPPSPIFSDGFESGDTSAWSVTVP